MKKNIDEIKRQLRNLRNQQSRLRAKIRDPELVKRKRAERNKKYWNELPPEKKKQLLEKHKERNRMNPERCKIYRKRHYLKHRDEILARVRNNYWKKKNAS